MTNTFTRATAAAAVLLFASASASAAVFSYDVSGTDSWDGLGSTNNTVVFIDLAVELGGPSGSEVTVDGIGWEVVIQTFGASWLSEVSVAVETSDLSDSIFVSPGAGDDLPGGATAYSSGGIVDLTDAGLTDLVLADGILRLEFFEGFDDVAGEIDGAWISGSLNFSGTVTPIPVPAALPLLLSALGFGAVAGRRRKT